MGKIAQQIWADAEIISVTRHDDGQPILLVSVVIESGPANMVGKKALVRFTADQVTDLATQLQI